jgi:hypothetical protein
VINPPKLTWGPRRNFSHILAASTSRILISEVPPSPDETVVSTSEDIALTCPYEDPTLGTGAAVEVAYTSLVDQHMVPS